MRPRTLDLTSCLPKIINASKSPSSGRSTEGKGCFPGRHPGSSLLRTRWWKNVDHSPEICVPSKRASWHMHTTSIDTYIQSLWRMPWIPKWHSCQNSKAKRPIAIASEQTKIMKMIMRYIAVSEHDIYTECKFQNVSLPSVHWLSKHR